MTTILYERGTKYGKNEKRLFTNSKRNNIIRKKYNPLKANNCEREGLPMKEKEEFLNVLAKKLSKKYNKRKQVIIILLEECKNLGYNIMESEEKIKDFYNI